jgi:hypothetical protein
LLQGRIKAGGLTLKYEQARKLAESGCLKSEDRYSIKKTITWLSKNKSKEIEKYDKQIIKWKKLLSNSDVPF